MTLPFAPLFFNAKADSSRVVPIRSTRRNVFLLHLKDATDIPIVILISSNPNGPQS